MMLQVSATRHSYGACLRSGLLWLSLFAAGCRLVVPEAPPPVPYPAGFCPRFVITYHPYGPSLDRLVGDPLPRYQGWTDERMHRDLERIGGAGFDEILLVLEAEDFAGDTFRLDRYVRFLELAETVPGSPSIALAIDGPPGSVSVEGLARWVVNGGLLERRALRRENNRIRIALLPGIRPEGGRHPALDFIATDGPDAEWLWPAPGRGLIGERSRTGMVVVSAAQRRLERLAADERVSDGEREWLAPRDKGKTLVTGLRAAFDQRASVVCVRSWNDYRNGDFIEPNSVDGRLAITAATREIARVRAAADIAPEPRPDEP